MIYIDFEYNKTKEAKVNLVSCAVLRTGDSSPTTFWLHNSEEGKKELKEYILENKEETFVAYAVTAEARSFISLGLDPKKFQWCDLYLEYRCLTNHNHRLMYGKQLIDGVEKVTSPPKNKWRRSEEEDEEANSSKPQHSLSSATYKLLNVKIDTEEKDAVRELILSEPIEFTDEERSRILKYNASDIAYLPRLLNAMVEEYKFLLGDRFNPYGLRIEMFLRGDYAARTAIMESLGYPIDYHATRNFSDSVPSILRECQDEINGFFPEIHPFKRKRDRGLRWDQSATRKWLSENGYIERGWTKTDTGLPSLSLDAFKEFFNFRHDYPTDNFGAQMVRYLGLRQHLNGFIPGGKRGSFWDSVSEKDQRVRPYFGIYGAQSARSQPKSTGFLFLKPAWMRSLCVPPTGRAIVGIDYKSQEFLIAGLLSGDKNMLDAYESGDPYLYLAKLAGAVPKDGTRKEYEKERETFKVTCLSGDTLVRVKDHGFKKIKDINKDDLVWDGISWKSHQGVKYMGEKHTTVVSDIYSTIDHKVLTNYGWREVFYAEKKRKGRKVYFKNAKRLQEPSPTWTEVWRVASGLYSSIIKKWRAIYSV